MRQACATRSGAETQLRRKPAFHRRSEGNARNRNDVVPFDEFVRRLQASSHRRAGARRRKTFPPGDEPEAARDRAPRSVRRAVPVPLRMLLQRARRLEDVESDVLRERIGARRRPKRAP